MHTVLFGLGFLYVLVVGAYAAVCMRARFGARQRSWLVDESEAPPEVLEALAKREPELIALGFTAVRGLSTSAGDAEFHSVYFEGPGAGALLSVNPGVAPAITFWSRSAEGGPVATSSLGASSMPWVLPAPHRTGFVSAMPVSRLLSAHARRCERSGGTVVPLDAGAMAALDLQWREWTIAKGFLRRRGDELGYTARGALRVAIGFLPPGRWVGRAVTRWRARALERELFAPGPSKG